MIRLTKFNIKAVAIFIIIAMMSCSEQKIDRFPNTQSQQTQTSNNRRLPQEDLQQKSSNTTFNSKVNDIINTNKDKISFGTFTKQNLDDGHLSTPTNSTINDTFKQNNKSEKIDSDKQPGIPLTEVNKPVIGKGFKIDNGISYQRIHIGQLEKKYLFVDLKLLQKDNWQQANITITFQGANQILAFCKYDDYDSCFIFKNLLKKDSNLFINIQCEEDCTYTLKGRWSDMEHLRPGQDFIFMFGDDKSQIFHAQLQDEDFEEVRIHLAPRTTRKPFDNIKMYGKYGSQKTPTDSDYDFKSVNLWEDGEGVFLLKKNMKSQSFNLLIVGQSESTYKLTCQLVKQKIHEIKNNQHLYEYLESQSTKKYHVAMQDIKIFEQYSFKFSILSGEADVEYYTDIDMKKQLPNSPFEYMKDSEYIISRDQLGDVAKSGIYIKVSTSNRNAVYTLKYVGIISSSPIQINQHVYSFIPVIQKPKIAYFNYRNWISEKQQKTNLKFTVSMIQVMGKIKPEFRVCKTTLEQCTNSDLINNFTTELAITSQETISQKQVYQFTISDADLFKINDVEKQANIIVKLIPQNSKANFTMRISLVALQFVNNNKVFYLREGRPFEQKFQSQEIKYYKYVNSDEEVQEIRVHINQISGNVRLSGLIKAQDNTKSISVTPQANTLRFTQNLTRPIIVTIKADKKSIVGVNMQVIHKSDSDKAANLMTIGEDLTYTVKIQPQTYTIFQVVPIFYDFNFYYSASHSVIACLIDDKTNKCVKQSENQTNTPNLSLKSSIKGASMKNTVKKAKIQILNPSSERSAEVTVIFHSRDIDRCQHKKIGKLYNELAKDKTCFDFILDEDNKNDLEVYVSKRQFSNIVYTVFLCGNSIQGATSQKFLQIPKNIITQKCNKTLEGWQVGIYWDLKSENNGGQSVKVDFIVQYEGGLIIIPEGVAYHAVQKSQSNYLRKFGYKLVNKVTTKIIINSIQGQFMAYAKIINEVDMDTEQISNINYHFESSHDVDYNQQPIITITENDMKQASCIDCLILIAVYTTANQGSIVDFEIQVVQKVQNLVDNTAIVGYLQANSFAYYSYQIDSKMNRTLLFVISDHNERCANIYLGTVEYPISTLNLAFTKNSSVLIYRHLGGAQKYFITVQSTKICDYSIMAITADTSIQRLHNGRQVLVQILKGNKQYFVFENYNQTFKIFSMNKLGEVKFYLNKSNVEINKKSFTDKELNTDIFQYTSQYTNVLTVSKSNPIFCASCSYFLAVEGIKNTISTLFLANPLNIIPLAQKKYFSDFLQKEGNFTLLSYKKLQKTQLQVTVHTGEIEITVIYKQYRSSQIFTAKSQHQSMTIDVTKDIKILKQIPQSDPNLGLKVNGTIRYTQRIPINLIIKSKSDKTTYTLYAKSLQKQKLSDVAIYQDIITGQPNHITISSEKVICLQGYYREANQDIIITVNNDNKKILSKLIVTGKVNRVDAAVNKTIIKNLMSLNLTSNESKYDGASYQICLKYDDSSSDQNQQENLSSQIVENSSNQNLDEVIFKAIVTQANNINLLPSDTETIINYESIFTIHNDGQFLLDVFECLTQGQSSVYLGTSRKQINNSTGKRISSVGMSDQKHAIKVSHEEPTTYVKIKSKLSVVRWLPIDYQTDEGTGYMKFAIGDLRYTSKFKLVSIQFQPLQNIKSTQSFIKEIQYTILISNDTKNLDSASECDSENTNVMVIPIQKLKNPMKSQQQIYNIYQVDKELLSSNFPADENIYLTLVAKLTLQLANETKKGQKHRNPSSDEHEHYRFIYNRQQLPLESYKPSKIETIPYHFLILVVVSIAGLFLLLTYLLVHKIIPLIARAKTSNLVQQKDAQPQMELAEVPPSSDRNQRAANVVIQSDEGFKK